MNNKEPYKRNGYTILIDLNRDSTLSRMGIETMKDRYLLKKYDPETMEWINQETSPQHCFARSACEFGSNPEHAQRLYEYASKNWMMFATPILTNAGTNQGMPISCFLNFVPDSVEGILAHHYENGYLASYGGGIGGDWSTLRSLGSRTSRGNVSSGAIPFIRMMDSQMLAFQQGATRRGSYAAYMSIEHPEVEEFLELRTVSGADPSRRCFGTGFHHALNIPDSFMVAVESGGKWDLVDPHTKEVRKTVDARQLWMRVLTKRLETGEPYLHFIDTSNRALPKPLRDRGLRINNSNLCNEIYLPTGPDRTAVCCLSSLNVEYFDDWSNDDLFIHDMMEMLDNVLAYFISRAPAAMVKAVNSAKAERSIGLGCMGFHTYLQKRGLPFESPMAVGANRRVFEHINTRATEANLRLGKSRGEAPDMQGTGRRFAHMIALAPNANIAPICGNTSPSIEPFTANAFKQNTLSGSFLVKNKILDKTLKDVYKLEGPRLEEVWSSITVNKGSISHLDFISGFHKQLFKTAMELDQQWVIEHAATRQPFICQGQSVNIFLPSTVHKNVLHKIHFAAWKKGLKGLYYCRSRSVKSAETISEATNRIDTNDTAEKEIPMDYKECLSCEG